MALVTYVLGDCPRCGGKQCFGNVDVYVDHVLRGCGRCKYKARVQLPAVKKKVLYLDQFFYSSAFRAGDTRFVDAAERVRQLTALQLLVAPFSSVHEDEARQWARHADLMEFIRDAAVGIDFESAYDVEQTQLHRSFHAWLNGESADYKLERHDAIREDIDTWYGYHRVEIKRDFGDGELIRDLKNQSIDGLVALFDEWRRQGPSFEADLRAEYDEAGRQYLLFYADYLKRMISGDVQAFLDAPVISQVVEGMMHLLPGDDLRAKAERCRDFFASDHFRNTPYQLLHARMLATLKMMVKEGQYMNQEKARGRLSGFFFDVKHIATYAPYVDAFVMDQPMAELVRRPTVDLRGRYGTRVFSLSNWDDFHAWLDEMHGSGMTVEHLEGLRLAYPLHGY